MKAKHQRLILVVFSVVSLCLAVVFVLRAFEENLIFFYSPSDIIATPPTPQQKIRVGGLVETGSVKESSDNHIEFRVTDGKHSLMIHYKGLLPNLFREGQGVVAEGTLSDNQTLVASNILAKHDENYMPKEVVDALKKTGHWEKQYER